MDVEFDEPGHRFVMHQPNGDGELRFHGPENGVIDLYHTEVDPALRGEGIAAALAEGAFEYALAHGLKVKVTCPYVLEWLERHPAERDLVVAR